MGLSMAKHLQKAGYNIFVYNRTKEKADELISNGATWCNTPKEVAEKSDIVFSIVGFPKDVEETYLGENGILNGTKEGSIVVDMTTSKPSLAKEIAKKCSESGVECLDAPVSGGDLGAKNAELVIMVGGEKSTYDKVLPFFENMGKSKLMGEAGAGQHTKMANQISIAACIVGTVETLMYAKYSGLSQEDAIEIIGGGSAANWQLNNMGPRIVQGNFEPGFYIKHFLKDMGIALEECRRMNLKLPGLELAYSFYEKALEIGLEDKGTQALYKVFEEMNK